MPFRLHWSQPPVWARPPSRLTLPSTDAPQDLMNIEAASTEPHHHPNYDQNSYQEVYRAVLELSKHLPDSKKAFGSKDEVDEVC